MDAPHHPSTIAHRISLSVGRRRVVAPGPLANCHNRIASVVSTSVAPFRSGHPRLSCYRCQTHRSSLRPLADPPASQRCMGGPARGPFFGTVSRASTARYQDIGYRCAYLHSFRHHHLPPPPRSGRLGRSLAAGLSPTSPHRSTNEPAAEEFTDHSEQRADEKHLRRADDGPDDPTIKRRPDERLLEEPHTVHRLPRCAWPEPACRNAGGQSASGRGARTALGSRGRRSAFGGGRARQRFNYLTNMLIRGDHRPEFSRPRSPAKYCPISVRNCRPFDPEFKEVGGATIGACRVAESRNRAITHYTG